MGISQSSLQKQYWCILNPALQKVKIGRSTIKKRQLTDLGFPRCFSLLISNSQLLWCFSLLHNHNPEACSDESLCMQMVICLWKTTVRLISLQDFNLNSHPRPRQN